MDRHKEGDLPQPPGIVEGFSEGFSLAQHLEDAPKGARRQERRAQGEAQINGLLTRVAIRRKLLQGTECPLKGYRRLPGGRASERPLAGPLPVGEGRRVETRRRVM